LGENKINSDATMTKGKVILVGAGCGDPELITVKAANWLRKADVVLTDRLVSKAILNEYVRPGAAIVYVGKQHNNAASVPQLAINQLMLQYALQGKLVVRLKGGDIAFFSNVLDELQTLVDNQVPYEIVPGITAASGASAYAGIPLTARGYATAVRFLTYYKPEVVEATYWKELATTDDTLVFYMSSETLADVVAHLIKENIGSDKWLAVVEQATTPLQQVHITNLYNYADTFAGKVFASPTLIIIGKVVSLHYQFSWLQNNKGTGEYFMPISQHTNLLNSIEHAG
jgi:uroporphyrin-III C-methyltransferase